MVQGRDFYEMTFKLVCYGDISIDVVLQVDRFPAPGLDTVVRSVRETPGGAANNVAVVAARLGVPVILLGCIGKDAAGEILLDNLRHAGVDTHYLQYSVLPTGRTYAICEPDAQRSFMSARNTNAERYMLSAQLQHELHDGDHLYLSGYSLQGTDGSRISALELAASAQSYGVLLGLDPSYLFAQQATYDLALMRVIRGARYFFPNRDEAALFPDLLTWDTPTRIVTRDSDGGILYSGVQDESSSKTFPAYPTTAINTTGGGDAFCAGFYAGLFYGYSEEIACHIGSATAAHIVAHNGAQEGIPTWAELQVFMQRYMPASLTL